MTKKKQIAEDLRRKFSENKDSVDEVSYLFDTLLREQPMFDIPAEDYQELKGIAESTNKSIRDMVNIAVKSFINENSKKGCIKQYTYYDKEEN